MDIEKYIKGYIDLDKPNECKEKITQKCEKSVAKQKTNCYINGTNETKTTNSKQETKTMKKNTNTLITELDNTMLTSNVAQLTDAVNKILVRLDALEAKNVAPKQEFKKLRETAEEVKKETKKVKKVAKVKTVKKVKKNPVIVNLQKKAVAMKETMTKAQLAAYEKMWSKKWSMVNKSIDKNNKEERSMAFAKGRIECAKNAIKMF